MSGKITNESFFQFFSNYHVIPAIGGFNIDQQFGGPVKVYASVETMEIDLTLALQLKVNVRTFNEKLGLIKDASNNVHLMYQMVSSQMISFLHFKTSFLTLV